MANTAQKVLDIARSQIGYQESGDNLTKYGAWYGTNGVAWCDMFVSWCAAQAGATDIVGKASYTVAHAQWFYNKGQWGTTPRVGAIVFFHFGNPSWGGRWKGIHHVAFVESVRANGDIVTIEGNTGGSNYNGGAVMRRVRSASQVAGYGYPMYKSPAPEVGYNIVYTHADSATISIFKAQADSLKLASVYVPYGDRKTFVIVAHANDIKARKLLALNKASKITSFVMKTTQDTYTSVKLTAIARDLVILIKKKRDVNKYFMVWTKTKNSAWIKIIDAYALSIGVARGVFYAENGEIIWASHTNGSKKWNILEYATKNLKGLTFYSEETPKDSYKDTQKWTENKAASLSLKEKK
jgi:hypothetical protein